MSFDPLCYNALLISRHTNSVRNSKTNITKSTLKLTNASSSTVFENHPECLIWTFQFCHLPPFLCYTIFVNHPKCLIWIFQFWNFPPIFSCLLTLFDHKFYIFKNIFGIFNQLLSTQNVNVARFARNVEWDSFCHFQTPCIFSEK